MTIPFALPFGRRRLVLSLDLQPAPPAAPSRAHRIPDLPDATDAELARYTGRSAAAEDRLRWEAQAVFYGLRPR